MILVASAVLLLISCDIGTDPQAPVVNEPQPPIVDVPTSSDEQDFIIDQNNRDLDAIPVDAITRAKETLVIAYNHTSHGSQLITGMNVLANHGDFGDRYAWASSAEEGSLELRDKGIPSSVQDLSQGDSEVNTAGDTPWVVATRTYLDNHGEVNVVMWSWCSINGHNAQRYLDNMEKLIAEYPGVKFVFMTGHAEGQGEDMSPSSVHYNNELIRDHCRQNGRILYDFAAIESYDPDGEYFWDKSMMDNLDYDNGAVDSNWAVEWIADNSGNLLALLTTECSGTAHSNSPQQANLNGVLKGIAAWQLFARLSGWEG